MVALVNDVSRDTVCWGLVPSIVVFGRTVLNIFVVEAGETTCGLVAFISISGVDVMVAVESPGIVVANEV